MQNKLMVLILFSTCFLMAKSQVVPAMINLPGAPVQLVSTQATLADLLETVTVKNVSDKVVVSFQMGLILSIPAPCALVPEYGPEQLMNVEHLTIAPGKEGFARNHRLLPQALQDFDKSGKGHVVLSQLAVISVMYGDGSIWRYTPTGRMYSDDLNDRAAKMLCSSSQAAVEYRSQVKADCEAKRIHALDVGLDSMEIGFGRPVGAFDCAADPGYGCSVASSDTSCTSTLCTGSAMDGSYCQGQICHVVGAPVPPAGGIKFEDKPKTVDIQTALEGNLPPNSFRNRPN